MTENATKKDAVVQVNEHALKDNLSKVVFGTVEETLHAILDTEAGEPVGGAKYEHSA